MDFSSKSQPSMTVLVNVIFIRTDISRSYHIDIEDYTVHPL